MNCFPSCEVSLPRIGKTYVSSKLDICKNPAVLTLSITSDGKRSVSSFVAGNSQEYRTIGNDFWPLQLQVKFRNQVEHGYYTEACISTVRTGNVTCFMNDYVDVSADSGCNSYRNSNNGTGFPVVILCVILATCLLMISVAIVAMFHRLYTSQRSNSSRKNSYNPSKNTTSGYPAMFDSGFHTKFPHDERLAVIDEVDEKEPDCVSIASSGFESGPLKSVSEDECTRHTDLSMDIKQPCSGHLMELRRQSQPLIENGIPTMESFKPRSSLPSSKHPAHAIL